MTTGKKVSALPVSDAHSAIVQKAIDLGVSLPKPKAIVEGLDEINMMLLAAGLPAKKRVQFIPSLDLIEWLNAV